MPGPAWFEIDERAAGTTSERLCGVFMKRCREPWYGLYWPAVAPRHRYYDGEGGMAMTIAIAWTHMLR